MTHNKQVQPLSFSFYKKGEIEALEKVQKKANKILPSLKKLFCTERLKFVR